MCSDIQQQFLHLKFKIPSSDNSHGPATFFTIQRHFLRSSDISYIQRHFLRRWTSSDIQRQFLHIQRQFLRIQRQFLQCKNCRWTVRNVAGSSDNSYESSDNSHIQRHFLQKSQVIITPYILYQMDRLNYTMM